MWRHHSASLQKYSKVEYIKERQSPYLCCVFYFKSISCLVFAWEHNKKDTFSQYFKFRQMSILLYIIIWVTKPQGLVMCSSLWLLFTSGECFSQVFSFFKFVYYVSEINLFFLILYLSHTVFINYILIIRIFYCACANYRFLDITTSTLWILTKLSSLKISWKSVKNSKS